MILGSRCSWLLPRGNIPILSSGCCSPSTSRPHLTVLAVPSQTALVDTCSVVGDRSEHAAPEEKHVGMHTQSLTHSLNQSITRVQAQKYPCLTPHNVEIFFAYSSKTRHVRASLTHKKNTNLGDVGQKVCLQPVESQYSKTNAPLSLSPSLSHTQTHTWPMLGKKLVCCPFARVPVGCSFDTPAVARNSSSAALASAYCVYRYSSTTLLLDSLSSSSLATYSWI